MGGSGAKVSRARAGSAFATAPRIHSSISGLTSAAMTSIPKCSARAAHPPPMTPVPNKPECLDLPHDYRPSATPRDLYNILDYNIKTSLRTAWRVAAGAGGSIARAWMSAGHCVHRHRLCSARLQLQDGHDRQRGSGRPRGNPCPRRRPRSPRSAPESPERVLALAERRGIRARCTAIQMFSEPFSSTPCSFHSVSRCPGHGRR